MKPARCLIPLVLAGCLFAGCEKRVVAVRDGWTDGSSPRLSVQPPPEPAKKGWLDTVGGFLFGWTRWFEAKPKPAAPTGTDQLGGWQLSQPALKLEGDPPDPYRAK